MKHTLKLRALTEEYDEDYESRNDDFERYARHFLKTNDCRLTKDVWTIKTDCSYDEIYEFLEDHGWGFFEFISLDDFTHFGQLYDYVWEQRRNDSVSKSIDVKQKSFNDMVKSVRSNGMQKAWYLENPNMHTLENTSMNLSALARAIAILEEDFAKYNAESDEEEIESLRSGMVSNLEHIRRCAQQIADNCGRFDF